MFERISSTFEAENKFSNLLKVIKLKKLDMQTMFKFLMTSNFRRDGVMILS